MRKYSVLLSSGPAAQQPSVRQKRDLLWRGSQRLVGCKLPPHDSGLPLATHRRVIHSHTHRTTASVPRSRPEPWQTSGSSTSTGGHGLALAAAPHLRPQLVTRVVFRCGSCLPAPLSTITNRLRFPSRPTCPCRILPIGHCGYLIQSEWVGPWL